MKVFNGVHAFQPYFKKPKTAENYRGVIRFFFREAFNQSREAPITQRTGITVNRTLRVRRINV